MAATYDFEYYVTNLDWDDGSPIQYTSQPLIFDRAINFNHQYSLPGFYKIKGLIFKKVLQTVNIYPPVLEGSGFIENYDEFESTPSESDSDEAHLLGFPETIGEVRSIETKDNYVNNQLNPNLDLFMERTGDKYKFSRVGNSATDIRIHRSDDEFNGALSVEIGPYTSQRNRSAGVITTIGNRFDTSVYNFVNYSMDLWLPSFYEEGNPQSGRKNIDGTYMNPSRPIAYYVYVRAYRYLPEDDDFVDFSDYEQTLDVVVGTDSWQRYEGTTYAPFPLAFIVLYVVQADYRKDRSTDDEPFKFFIKNLSIEVPNEKNKIRPVQWEKFQTNIVVNPSENYINSSPFYMYDEYMMIGGFTKKSFHFKNLMRLAGYDINTETKYPQTTYDAYNEFDTIHMLDNIAKYDKNLYDDFLDRYSEEVYEGNTLINTGIVDRKKHGVFENTQLSDADLGCVKIYKGVKPMWEQLGFDSNEFNIPSDNQYWGNIIPKDYTVLDRNGVTTQQLEDPMDGSLTPRIPREEYIIDESSNQNWKDGYRWPQLPSVDKFSVLANDTGSSGHLVNEPNKIFFGSKSSWDGDDRLAKITLIEDSDPNLIFNLNFNDVTNEEIEDATNNYKVEHRTDFSVVLSPFNRITKGSIYPYDGIDGDLEKQAF